MEPLTIQVRIDGEDVCKAVLTDDKAMKACDMAIAMAIESEGSAESDAEQMRPLLCLLLGYDGYESLTAAVDGDPWRLAEAWAALASQCQAMRVAAVANAAKRYTADSYEPSVEHVNPHSRPLSDCKPGRCASRYAGILVNDSASVMMRVLDLMRDESLAFMERLEVLNAMVLPEAEGIDMGDLAKACWLAFGIDLSGEHADSSRTVIDWDEDAGRIRSSLRMAYGVVWDEIASTTPFMDVCDMVSGLMEGGTDTPLRQAVRFRSSPVPPNASPEQRKAFMEAVEHFAIRREAADPYGDEHLRSING